MPAFPKPSRRWQCFFLSAGFHVIVCLLAIPAAEWIQPPDEQQYFQRLLAKALVIRLPVSRSASRIFAPPAAAGSARQTIVQPSIAAHAAVAVNPLPQVVLWDTRTHGRQWPIRETSDPGNLERSRPARVLAAIPMLDPPNGILTASNLQAPDLAARFNPVLPAPPATTLPVQSLDPPPALVQPAIIDPHAGYPVQVLVSSLDPAPARRLLIVPAVSQLGAGLPGPGADGKETVSSPPEPDAVAAAAPRMTHPVSGYFDVIVQSSTTDAFPDATLRLTGTPVYTVYLDVGSRREWILQYCIPGQDAANRQVSANVVRLANPAPVRAPWPLVTVRPQVSSGEGSGYMVIHGKVDTAGRFRDLSVLTGTEAVRDRVMLALLSRWELRPASLDGKPVLVEILLAVPPDPVSLNR